MHPPGACSVSGTPRPSSSPEEQGVLSKAELAANSVEDRKPGISTDARPANRLGLAEVKTAAKSIRSPNGNKRKRAAQSVQPVTTVRKYRKLEFDAHSWFRKEEEHREHLRMVECRKQQQAARSFPPVQQATEPVRYRSAPPPQPRALETQGDVLQQAEPQWRLHQQDVAPEHQFSSQKVNPLPAVPRSAVPQAPPEPRRGAMPDPAANQIHWNGQPVWHGQLQQFPQQTMPAVSVAEPLRAPPQHPGHGIMEMPPPYSDLVTINHEQPGEPADLFAVETITAPPAIPPAVVPPPQPWLGTTVTPAPQPNLPVHHGEQQIGPPAPLPPQTMAPSQATTPVLPTQATPEVEEIAAAYLQTHLLGLNFELDLEDLFPRSLVAREEIFLRYIGYVPAEGDVWWQKNIL